MSMRVGTDRFSSVPAYDGELLDTDESGHPKHFLTVSSSADRIFRGNDAH
jgi:hypothetical protein